MQPRMGNLQLGRSQHKSVVKKDVDVDSPRSPMARDLPSQALFNLLESIHKFVGLQRGLHLSNAVDKPILVFHSPRLSLIPGGTVPESTPFVPSNFLESSLTVRNFVAQVRTQTDVDG
jgi:hypothetical protein